MKKAISLFITLICVWLAPAFSAQPLLQERDVQRVMNRLFSLHVENKELNPLIIRRCFKLYVEQFDPDKSYLLEQEVAPYLQMSDEKVRLVMQRMSHEDYSDFIALNQTIQRAIVRAQSIRDRFSRRDLEASAQFRSDYTGIHARFAQTENELAERLKSRLVRFYLYHKSRSNLSTAERQSKLIQLFAKKAFRLESSYLYLNNNGTEMDAKQAAHQFSLHLLKAFAKSLDTHSSFYSPEEAYETRLSLEKQFEGVGVILFEGVDGVMISELIKGSPAEQIGKISINDLLVEIDGRSVEKASFEDVLDLLKKDNRKEIVLGFKRMSNAGDETFFRVALSKKPIVMNDSRIMTSWEKYGDGIIGKISLFSFYESNDGLSSEKDIKEAIRAFQKIAPLRGLVLDLRENSGGFLSQAVKVAGLFLTNGVVVISKYSQGDVHYLRNIVGKSFYNGPLVVLTSKMSASAAEIVAQALQDYGVALIVGDERTFGKGSIQYQTVTDSNADLFFKVTVGRYYTASGRTTQIEGVKADIVVPTSYSPYNIGERFLEYPLSPDRVQSAFVDPLSDLDLRTKHLFEQKYMPYLQRVVSFWRKVLPTLKKNSEKRLMKNPAFQAMLHNHEQIRARIGLLPPNSIDESPVESVDLQMNEAVNIVIDMINIEEAHLSNSAARELQPTGSD